jgi:hypothetical protein
MNSYRQSTSNNRSVRFQSRTKTTVPQQAELLPRRKRIRRFLGSTTTISLLGCWILVSALAACCSSSGGGVNAFGLRKWVSRRTNGAVGSEPGTGSFRKIAAQRFLADKSKNGVGEEQETTTGSTWSKPVNGRTSSPLQVRKRVRAVLEKARTRTGVNINSTSSISTSTKPSNVVAEAASIGGLGEDYIIGLKPVSQTSQQQQEQTSEETNSNGEVTNNKGPRVFPDEVLTVERASNATTTPSTARKPNDFDVIRGDAPAATQFCEPLPFALPKLTPAQKRQLAAGERVQEQARMGREGSGYVVVDVKTPPYVVWECLLDFEDYPSMISTVKEMQLYTSEKLNVGYVNEKPILPGTGRETRHYGTPSVTRAAFTLSKFRLNIAAVHKYSPHPDGDYMVFTLDKSCTNMVLKGAKGIWHTVADPDGREVSYFIYSGTISPVESFLIVFTQFLYLSLPSNLLL